MNIRRARKNSKDYDFASKTARLDGMFHSHPIFAQTFCRITIERDEKYEIEGKEPKKVSVKESMSNKYGKHGEHEQQQPIYRRCMQNIDNVETAQTSRAEE